MTAPRLLVADIGGTNTRAALSDGVQLRASTITRFRNVEFGSLAEVLAAFVAQHGTPPLDGACIALAGPVTQQGAEAVGQMTNLQWQLDTAQMRAVTGAPQAAIINDLQAQAYALPHLDKSHIEQLFGPAGTPGAPQLVLGVGTGFNAAVAHSAGGDLRVVPASEAGHIGLPVGTAEEWELAQFVGAKNGFAALEDVLSGRGLERVYDFVRQTIPDAPAHTAAEIVATADTYPATERALQLFARILGRASGDLSLIHLPLGGVYLVGGVARAIAPYMARYGAQAFADKGRFTEFMAQFGLSVLHDDYAALIGCAGRLAVLPRKTEAQVTVS